MENFSCQTLVDRLAERMQLKESHVIELVGRVTSESGKFYIADFHDGSRGLVMDDSAYDDIIKVMKYLHDLVGFDIPTCISRSLQAISRPNANVLMSFHGEPKYAADTRFLSFDVEAWERNSDDILEIGFSCFDLQSRRIKTTHMLIIENIARENGKYVENNKYGFIFGKSKQLYLNNALRLLQAELRSCDVLVGHSIGADFRFLSDYDVEFPRGLTIIDTQKMVNARKHLKNRNLTKLANELGISTKAMHNAGNDSHFTMECFLRMSNLDYFPE